MNRFDFETGKNAPSRVADASTFEFAFHPASVCFESYSVTEFLPIRDARMIVLFLVHLYEYCTVSHKKTNIVLQLAFALTRQLGLDIARKELREFEAASRVGEKYFERLRGFG